MPVSWQGVNDLSAHPATTGPNTDRRRDRGHIRGSDGRAQHARLADQSREPVCLAAVLGRLFTDTLRSPPAPVLPAPMVSSTTSMTTRCRTFTRRFTPTCSTRAWSTAPTRLDARTRRPRRSRHGGLPGVSLHLSRRLHVPAVPLERPVRLDSFSDAGGQRPGRRHRPISSTRMPLVYLQNINHNPLDAGRQRVDSGQELDADGILVASPDVVGFPDLAGDALGELDRSDPAGQ